MTVIKILRDNIFPRTGRLNRARYIKYFIGLLLLSAIVTAILNFVAITISGDSNSLLVKVVSYAVNLVFFVGYVGLVIRRLHDLNKDNWMAVLTLIPIVNLLLGIYLMAVPGTVGRNQYGEDPLM